MNLDYVNLSDFPLHQPGSEAFQQLVEEWRSKLTDRISLVLKYETEPGVFISAEDRKHIYGPSAPGPDRAEKIATN